jgi:hypothetical protein
MARRPKQPITQDLPLYIRWSPDRAEFGIELRLDLVSKIAAQVRLSEQDGAELGGFLIGSLPVSEIPTIRIENIEMVSTASDDATVFLPEPSRLKPSGGSRQAPESGVIGFFRTHVRVGAMRPSLADRSIFAHEFQRSPYVVLLVHAQEPHMAAFFVSKNGQLPEEPSVREFEFDENEFKALPEVPAELPEPQRAKQEAPGNTRKLGLYARVAALILVAVGACALTWSFARQPNMPHWFTSANQLQLTIKSEQKLLRISWNHTARQLNQASGATLVISGAAGRSEIRLGMDDLRLGSVEYEGTGDPVDVQMVLDTPAGRVTADSVRWGGR